ncbi:substrate-binding domain-containing protein [Sagittula salina]|uniref:Substrate-binding domain-containing protein n=1 Tax=Sagittula salina TaxID=2820268 RepID=A0A940S541_9RHOB|nr:substrate-binding domain-containing protein [Sagittula salina]MBP0484759.1 substrate-binding domain-containing protein [Sagittula salina]
MTFRNLTLAAMLATAPLCAQAEESIIVQSTTSTANSGLYDYLLPLFTGKTGITVNVVAVGTGQAIKNAANCDGDVLLVHAKPAEEKFVAEGRGTQRTDLMYNDFVVVGPAADPAGIAGSHDIEAALKSIADAGAAFASRGDDSGTHKAEMRLWQAAGVTPDGDWYRPTGSGMGATLNTGIGMGAYVLTDRATWINFGNKQDYQIAVEGDDAMFNQYGVIPVNPARCPAVKVDAGKAFSDWLLSPEGQEAIAGYKIDGQQLFFPNAPKVAN